MWLKCLAQAFTIKRKRNYHEVKEAILSLYKKNRKRDDYRPMTFKLRQMGFHLNHKTVLKLMNE